MKWSRYNYVLPSRAHGHLLYNALSNTFAEVDDQTYAQLEAIRQSPEAYDFAQQPALCVQLTQMKALVEDGEEEQSLNLLKLKRLYTEYDTSALTLTIAPTLACNFACPYCFQENHRQGAMQPETEDRILEFIQRFGQLKYIRLIWFGGEPLLQFDRVQSLTEKIASLAIPFCADMITNGYLLTPDVIQRLDDLKIRQMQITLDGPQATHDRRRVLMSGEPTYQRILDNLHNLFRVWKGIVKLRVNVDKTNWDAYHLLHQELRRTFTDASLKIYPGIVSEIVGVNPDLGCFLNKEDEVAFLVQQYRQYGIADLPFYPTHKFYGCTATTRNGFVIGPSGELYKCWNDVGKPEMVVGSVDERTPWNLNLLAKYMVGVSYFDDPGCQQCFYMPVCDGGCANFRLWNKYAGAQYDPCLKFAKGLPELLEIHYEQKQKRPAAAQANTP